MPIKDPEARRAYTRAWQAEKYKDPEYRKRHQAAVRAVSARVRARLRELLNEFRKDGCLLCTETTLCCLDAHHTDPGAKDFSIGEAVHDRTSPAKVAAELAKCVCLCKNCHAKLHAGLVELRDNEPMAARLLWEQEAAGSIPAVPTTPL